MTRTNFLNQTSLSEFNSTFSHPRFFTSDSQNPTESSATPVSETPDTTITDTPTSEEAEAKKTKKKDEKKKKKEEQKKKVKLQKKSRKELELLAQLERIEKGRVKPIRKWNKPPNVVPPSYSWNPEQVFKYFIHHPLLALESEQDQINFLPEEKLKHPARDLQMRTKGNQWLMMNNSTFRKSPFFHLARVQFAKYHVFRGLGVNVELPEDEIPKPSESHQSVIHLKIRGGDENQTGILCNDPVEWNILSKVPTSIVFEPIFPDLPENTFFTLLFLDIDFPTHVFPDLSPMILWQVSNIRNSNINEGEKVFDYLPPLPPQNSGPHRCVFLLCKQKDGLMQLPSTTIPSSVLAGRSISENLLEYLEKHNLQIQSVRFTSTSWTEDVGKYYEDLGISQPTYFCKPELTPKDKTKKKRLRQQQEQEQVQEQ